MESAQVNDRLIKSKNSVMIKPDRGKSNHRKNLMKKKKEIVRTKGG